MSTALMEPVSDRPRECDVIMKGGITSGVVYPLAVHELSQTYRFKNIGGTSAGAIAAALTAAAELGRGKPGAGFDELKKLPEFLGARLLSLFQPSPRTRPAFEVLLSFLGKDSTTTKSVRAIGRILPFYWIAALFSALLGGGLWYLLLLLVGAHHGHLWPQLIGGVLVALVSGVLVAVARFLQGSWSALNANGFGLCKGLSQVEGQDALTPWLAEELNRTAGRDPKGEPLTFGNLWGGEPDETHRTAQESDPTLRQINLEVMTTSLTHGWPRRIPFSTKDLFFDPREFREYFPEDVVGWMEKHPWCSKDPKSLRNRVMNQTRFLPLPAPWNFPVVVAARMSLSFPGLFSAVPLYGVDWSLPDNQKADREGRVPRLDCCWFSDGGIGSNFPVHFFDGLLPSRPTFGINLRPFSQEHPQDLNDETANVEFPSTAGEEVLPTWTPISDALQFVLTIIDTMQNWVDNTQMRLPGYRDRVVHVLLSDAEGGLNLDMKKGLIEKLSLRGRAAGEQLSHFNWDAHRWTRYLTAMSQLEIKLEGMDKSYASAFRDFLTAYDSDQKPYARSAAWKASAVARTESLMGVAGAWAGSGQTFTKNAPSPEPELRIGPKR